MENNNILISLEKLAKLLSASAGVVKIFTSHFSLYKFISYQYVYKPKKTRIISFILNDNSLQALDDYLQKRRTYRKWNITRVKNYYKRKKKEERCQT